MTQHPRIQEIRKRLDESIWHDLYLKQVRIDFNSVEIILDNRCRIVCQDYIGIVNVGQWDEVVVYGYRLSEDSIFLLECTRRTVSWNSFPNDECDSVLKDSGGPWRDFGAFLHFSLDLIDKTSFEIVCGNIDVHDMTPREYEKVLYYPSYYPDDPPEPSD